MEKNKTHPSYSKNLNVSHAHLRRDFKSDSFSEKKVARHPMRQFSSWFKDAVKKKLKDSNAFVLATSQKNQPAARVLLMKAFSDDGITFFTNYASAKGKQLAANPNAEAVFFWGKLNRQVRLCGKVVRLSRKESLDYFRSRPREAQLAACASDQSSPILSREKLEHQYAQLNSKYPNQPPDMPVEWGGYLLKVSRVEFWQGRPSRLHDRLLYSKSPHRDWEIVRLQP